jgi:hypothetical protein
LRLRVSKINMQIVQVIILSNPKCEARSKL